MRILYTAPWNFLLIFTLSSSQISLHMDFPVPDTYLLPHKAPRRSFSIRDYPAKSCSSDMVVQLRIRWRALYITIRTVKPLLHHIHQSLTFCLIKNLCKHCPGLWVEIDLPFLAVIRAHFFSPVRKAINKMVFFNTLSPIPCIPALLMESFQSPPPHRQSP